MKKFIISLVLLFALCTPIFTQTHEGVHAGLAHEDAPAAPLELYMEELWFYFDVLDF